MQTNLSYEKVYNDYCYDCCKRQETCENGCGRLCGKKYLVSVNFEVKLDDGTKIVKFDTYMHDFLVLRCILDVKSALDKLTSDSSDVIDLELYSYENNVFINISENVIKLGAFGECSHEFE